MSTGSLVVVGTGIKLAEQCTPEARREIEAADAVIAASGDPVALKWLTGLNANTRSLHVHYKKGRSRKLTYQLMTEDIVTSVREGNRVCAVFYGHPGVFVRPSHAAIRALRAEGFDATMQPAVSAEDCLFADIGFDPAATGCQTYEASDWLINERRFDTRSVLILWQIAVVADRSYEKLTADPRRTAVLRDALLEFYPADHPVTLYEAATLAVGKTRLETIPLGELDKAESRQETTLYIPPLGPTAPSQARLDWIAKRLGG